MKWEILVFETLLDGTIRDNLDFKGKKMKNVAPKLGQEGWEPTGVCPLGPYFLLWVFKRPVSVESGEVDAVN